MKIEHLIVQHLYNSKRLTLQDIGTFTLSPDVVMNFENDKEAVLPENAVSFEFNKKAPQDEDLINFIVSQTRKIKPLATSDLESYSILAKQFLNIGKPFPIEGLGVLQKSQEGNYEFIQGTVMNSKLDAAPALLKEKSEEQISFSTQPKAPTSKKWIWVSLILLVVLSGALLYYFFKKENTDKQQVFVAPVTTDTIATIKDTTTRPVVQLKDSTAIDSTLHKNDGYTFKIVIREYSNKDVADRAFAKYTTYGHKLLLYPKDSSTYKIAMPFNRPLSDTTKTRDSLRIFFNTRTYVELN